MKKIIMAKKILIFMMISIFSMINVESKASSIEVNAASCILIEKDSKRVLYEKDKDKRLLTASICKILTAIVVIENIDLEKTVVVDKKTTLQTGSSIYLKENMKVKIKDLLHGLLLRSGNDAAYLLAVSTASSLNKFVSLMNEKAKEIGMKSSTFTNPSGLDEENANYSTAYDMAILMAYCLDNDEFRKITSTKKYVYKTIDDETFCYVNKHKLVLGYDYITGGKTGYTEKARRTLITSAKKGDMELIAVTFNCSNDWNEHVNLFDYGFENYEMRTVLKRQILNVDDSYNAIPYIAKDIKYPVRNNEKVSFIIYLLKSPKNEIIIGKAKMYVDGKIKEEINIYRYY